MFRFVIFVYAINILQEFLQSRYQFLVCGAGKELQWLHSIRPYRRRRVGYNMRHQVPGWEVIIRCRRVAVGGWHNERNIL